MKLLVTGGAGFIGSNFVRHALERWAGVPIVILDKLTYAGNRHNVPADGRVTFIHGDICDIDTVCRAMAGCTHVLNFAAETHVDRSILESGAFVHTDVEGTRVLLEATRDHGVERYLQVSTDEVYGDVEAPRRARESDPVAPRSPYSASKAGGDLMVVAYHATYAVPTLITRGSNTYGPYQYPEKLIPLFITNALDRQPLPIYGDGLQMRDWLFVHDHCTGIATVLERGKTGETYNVGCGAERTNLDVVERIVKLTGADPALLSHVADRPGHDRRYALDTRKVRALGWEPGVSLEHGIEETVAWYQSNRQWWEPLKLGSFKEYYQRQYGNRLTESRR